MSITLNEATEIAEFALDRARSEVKDLTLIPSVTETFDVGWLFYHHSARYLETRDDRYQVAGNVGIFVSRSDGKVHFVINSRPVAVSIAAYRACGNPNARHIAAVCLCGFTSEAAKRKAIGFLRQQTTMTLGEAKRVVDACLAGESPVISMRTETDAHALVAALGTAGFVARVPYGA